MPKDTTEKVKISWDAFKHFDIPGSLLVIAGTGQDAAIGGADDGAHRDFAAGGGGAGLGQGEQHGIDQSHHANRILGCLGGVPAV